jgi:hypothetical protein
MREFTRDIISPYIELLFKSVIVIRCECGEGDTLESVASEPARTLGKVQTNTNPNSSHFITPHINAWRMYTFKLCDSSHKYGNQLQYIMCKQYFICCTRRMSARKCWARRVQLRATDGTLLTPTPSDCGQHAPRVVPLVMSGLYFSRIPQSKLE